MPQTWQEFTITANGVTLLLDNRRGGPRFGRIGIGPPGATGKGAEAPGIEFVLSVQAGADLGGGALTMVIARTAGTPTTEDWEPMTGPSGAVAVPAAGTSQAYQHPAPWIGLQLADATGADIDVVLYT